MYPNWLQRDIIPRSVASNTFLKIGFSQNGEDDFIRAFFWDRILANVTGTYVDIGAYHESLYSNSKLLNLAGWRGVAVDANPDLVKPWIDERPDDVFLNYAIKDASDSSDVIELRRYHDGAINTINPEREKHLQQNGIFPKDRVCVQALTIAQLASQISQFNSKPDFVNIDIEFVDYLDELPAFLSILNYPLLLCLEWTSHDYNFSNYKESREFKVLTSQGYEIIGFISSNIFAKRQS